MDDSVLRTGLDTARDHWREVAGMGLLAAAPTSAVAGVCEDRGAVIVTGAAAAVVGVLTAVVIAGARSIARDRGTLLRRPIVAVATVVGVAAVELLLAVVVTALSPTRSAGIATSLPQALGRGWSWLVTSPVPSDAEPRLLVPLALLVCATTVVGCSLTLAGADTRETVRGGHDPTPVALIPGFVAFLATSIATGGRHVTPSIAGVLVVAGAATFLAAQPRAVARHAAAPVSGAGPAVRPRLTWCAAGLLAVVAVTLAAPWLTLRRSDEPYDPRRQLVTPTVPAGAISPLDLAAGRLLDPDRPVLTIRSERPLFTRLVALERYDGVRWTTADSFERSGSTIVVERGSVLPTASVSAEVVVEALDGPWVPVAAGTREIEGLSVLVAPRGGSMVAAAGDVADARYRLVADVPQLDDLTALVDRPAGSGPAAQAASIVPAGLPDPLRAIAEEATRGADTPLARAATLEGYLRAVYERDDSVVPGQSYGHLVRALTESKAGTEQQFATAFAVLARVVGLPSRVVVGFGPGSPSADGTFVVRNGDVRVWPEVLFEEAGWVAFDPAPPLLGADAEQPVPAGVGGRLRIDLLPSGEEAIVDTRTDAAPIESRRTLGVGETSESGGIGILATIAIAALVVPLLGLLVVVVLKRARTSRRRRAASAHDRVLGAWHDVLDRMREAGDSDPGAATVEELVASTGGAELTGLFRPVNRALYSDAANTSEDAQQAWRARDRYVGRLARHATRRCRIRRAIDPRPLGYRRQPKVGLPR